MKNRKITLEEIDKLKPCKPAKEFLGADWSGTLLDILNHPDVSDLDKIWVGVRLVPKADAVKFAAYCASYSANAIATTDAAHAAYASTANASTDAAYAAAAFASATHAADAAHAAAFAATAADAAYAAAFATTAAFASATHAAANAARTTALLDFVTHLKSMI